jgi:hypothetical protein
LLPRERAKRGRFAYITQPPIGETEESLSMKLIEDQKTRLFHDYFGASVLQNANINWLFGNGEIQYAT